MIAINNYLALASILFVIGIFGVFLNKKYNYHTDVNRVNATSGKHKLGSIFNLSK